MPGPGALSGHFLSRQPDLAPTPSLGLSVARPKNKLKALHWEKVDSPVATHWAAHAPSAEEREEKYLELSRKGILDEVEKLFMAKETKRIGQGTGKKDDKKQIISNDLRKAFRKTPYPFKPSSSLRMLTRKQKLPLPNSRNIPWTRSSR
jgi:cytokinesis protein